MDDPNFEQNRIEYKRNKIALDRGAKTKADQNSSEIFQYFPFIWLTYQTADSARAESASASTSGLPDIPEFPSASTSSAPVINSKDTQDFFSAIGEEQPTIFNPQTNRSVLPSGVQNPLKTMLSQSQYDIFPIESLHTEAWFSTYWFPFATGNCYSISAESFQ